FPDDRTADRVRDAFGRAGGAPDMTVQVSDRFVDTNGTRLFVMDRGRGRALVFLHGLGWDHTLWHGVTQAFAHEYRVIAGDTRGHGRSAKPDGPYTIALFAEDWFAAFKNLRVRQACLIGFSQGGMIAQTLAVQHPEIVSAQLASIGVPTLVMYGEEDVLTPPSVVTSVASHIPGAELVGIPGADHMIPVEKAEEFELALDTFLKKHYEPSL